MLPCLTKWFTFSRMVCLLILSPTFPDISFERISFGSILIRVRSFYNIITIMNTELLFQILIKQRATLERPDTISSCRLCSAYINACKGFEEN